MFGYVVYSTSLGNIAMFQTKWNAIMYSFLFMLMRLLAGDAQLCSIRKESRW